MLDSELNIGRTFVEVNKIDSKTGKMDLIVPAWDPKKTVTVPLFRIGRPELLDQIHNGVWLLASVNLAAKRPEDLLIHAFEPTPTAIPKRELGYFPSI